MMNENENHRSDFQKMEFPTYKDLARPKAEGYCQCEGNEAVTTGYETWFGYWFVCTKCGKRIEDEGFIYYNHYDGEDHELLWD